jgi:dehydrogenase/reductase SDR family member 12
MPSFHKTFQGQLRSLNQGIDTVIWLALADTAQLKSGALYLDRAEQAKHTFMSGTKYKEAEVDTLWASLCGLAGIQEQGQTG